VTFRFGILYSIYCILYICLTCTVHRTVISSEHLDVASTGFFVLLASFAVYGYKLKTHICIVFTDFQHTDLELYPFQNLSLGFILKIFLRFRKYSLDIVIKYIVIKK